METIVDGKWHWYSIMADMNAQGIEDFIVEPLSVRDHYIGGKYQGEIFGMTWWKDKFLLLSTPQERPELVEALSKIVGYEPFAKYTNDIGTTVEWDKVDPEGRFQALQYNENPEWIK